MSIPTHYDAIQDLVPNAEVGVTTKGDQVIIHWLDERKQPSEEAIQAKLKELQSKYDAQSYSRNRQQNYPNEHDLLIALWEKVMEGRGESADALEVKRQEIKKDIPKPT